MRTYQSHMRTYQLLSTLMSQLGRSR